MKKVIVSAQSEDKIITGSMLSDIVWINKQLTSMGEGYDKTIAREEMGKAVEFIKGALWERQRINKFAGDFLREIASGSVTGPDGAKVRLGGTISRRASEIAAYLNRR